MHALWKPSIGMDWFWLIGTGIWNILASKCRRLAYHTDWPYMYYSYQDVYFQLMPATARQTQEMPLAFDYIKLKKTTHALHQRMLRSEASNIALSKQTVVYTRAQKQHLDCIRESWIVLNDLYIACLDSGFPFRFRIHYRNYTANKSCPPFERFGIKCTGLLQICWKNLHKRQNTESYNIDLSNSVYKSIHPSLFGRFPFGKKSKWYTHVMGPQARSKKIPTCHVSTEAGAGMTVGYRSGGDNSSWVKSPHGMSENLPGMKFRS